VAWNAALLSPDLFRGVVGMNVPFVPPSPVDMLSALEAGGIKTFYMQDFQNPGVAEAELEADPEATIRRVWYSSPATGPVASWPASWGLVQAFWLPRWNPNRRRIG
jgi:pimeloyl-ACP methyl ester carboxylesterase